MAHSSTPLPLARVLSLIGLGLAAGFMSGMFGVGGGIVIVPGLMAIAGFSQRLASGTSLGTIIPLASVGVISYATHGSVSWVGALLLALGAMAGAKLGTWLLARIKLKVLQLFFVAFMVVAIVSMFLVVPSRDADLTITVGMGIALAAVGFLTGVLSGLLGVGGGVIVVPALMLLFGASDLVAKGTSLLMMIPTALIGTFSNVKQKTVDLRAVAAVGLPACATTFLGSWCATLVSPNLANILFAAFLALVALRLLINALKKPKKPEDPTKGDPK